ncbi:hypothetical protein ACE7GA_21970 [Roseomonas sp. CCTCC AB2023176]|uniref:hypothetical protein n=1 Tax=Roseomonas sp. CCTCC AB2023176 TaxID=3342640 RepID=UPI0035DA5453
MRKRPGTGDTLEGFRLAEIVHDGAYAVLHAATHPDHPGPLLVKLPLLQSTDPAAIVSFEMEQMILPRLAGPHVPRFIAAGDFSAEPYIAMERIPGPSLAARAPDLPLPPGRSPPSAQKSQRRSRTFIASACPTST